MSQRILLVDPNTSTSAGGRITDTDDEQWLQGEVASLRAIAQSAGKSEPHVSQVMRTAFLAPDLVEPLLQGHPPAQLTLRGVM